MYSFIINIFVNFWRISLLCFDCMYPQFLPLTPPTSTPHPYTPNFMYVLGRVSIELKRHNDTATLIKEDI